MVYTNKHGFTILRDSKVPIEATVRINESEKYTFLGKCTVEEKITPKYGRQAIIVVRMDANNFPKLETTEYKIKYPRIEILLPEEPALTMRLLSKKKDAILGKPNFYDPNFGWRFKDDAELNQFGHVRGCQCKRCNPSGILKL